MAKKGKDYFGMPWLISLIFAIIPVTSWLFGAVTRFQEGKFLAGLLRLEYHLRSAVLFCSSQDAFPAFPASFVQVCRSCQLPCFHLRFLPEI